MPPVVGENRLGNRRPRFESSDGAIELPGVLAGPISQVTPPPRGGRGIVAELEHEIAPGKRAGTNQFEGEIDPLPGLLGRSTRANRDLSFIHFPLVLYYRVFGNNILFLFAPPRI